jgi:hypothetical protein
MTATPPRFSHNFDSTSRGGHSGLMHLVQERERRDCERPVDVHVAEAVAFLISAHGILENLSSESFGDPRCTKLIASVCGKVFEAPSTLDDFNVTERIEGESTAGIGCLFASLPTWWECLNDLGSTT